MTLAERLTQAQNAIDGLTALANSTTSAGDTNITDAVSTLIDGYNKGGGGKVEITVEDTAPLVLTNKHFRGVDKLNLVKSGGTQEFLQMPLYGTYSMDRVMDISFSGWTQVSSTTTNMSDLVRYTKNIGVIDFGGVTCPPTLTRFCYQMENNPIVGYPHKTVIRGIDFSNVTTFSNGFGLAPNIDTQIANGFEFDIEWNGTIKANIPIFNGNNDNVLNFTRRSLVELFEHLSTETTGTVSLGTRLLAKLTADDIAIATSKGWTVN